MKNKEANKNHQKRYRKMYPLRYKGYFLKKKYGISLNDFNAMLLKQDNKCAICNKIEDALDYRTKLPRSLAVDHCHKTNKVRGLVCTRCNRGIGYFEDSIEILKKAILYLGIHNQ